MPNYLTPGVYFETVDVAPKGIAAIRTDIAAFVGIAAKGALNKPTRVNSWEQFRSAFGGFIPNGYLAYAVKAFFENGGRTCYAVRVAAECAPTESDASTLQPYDRLISIVNSVDGFARGAVVTVRQDPDIQRDHLLVHVDRANRRLIWEHPLETEFTLNDFLRPLHYHTGASVAHGVLLDEKGNHTLRIEASSPGAWGNGLEVRVGRSSSAATMTLLTDDVQEPEDGMAFLVKSVVGFPVGSLVKAFQQDFPENLVTYRIVAGGDPIRNLLTLDQPLHSDLPLGKTFDPIQPIYFETLEFSLTVYLGGRVRENYSGLSLVTAPEAECEQEKGLYQKCHAERLVNSTSRLIRIEDCNSPSPFWARLPDPQALNLTKGVVQLKAGRDGIAALRPEDFIGDRGSEKKDGLRTLEDVDEVAIVAVPDILIQPTPRIETAPLPEPDPDPCFPRGEPLSVAEPRSPRLVELAPKFSLDQIFRVQQALVAHCEAQQDRIALLDPPVIHEKIGVVDVGEIQSWRQRFDSKYAALYYPWVLVYDPLRTGGQVVRAIPPSGHVAGIFARTDIEMGVHKAPANIELRWAQDLSEELNAEIQGVLNPLGINCIRTFPGRGLRVYGARTVCSDPSWRYVNVRRLLMMIEEAVEDSVQWAVFEPNDFYLRQLLSLAISNFLQALWERGALVGETMKQAFYVKCDEENNPPPVTQLGQLIAEVGVSPVIPAEFVVFRIGRTEDELEIIELNGGSQWP